MPSDPDAIAQQQAAQEDYARRYDEAIKKARRKLLHPDEDDDQDREIPAPHDLIPVETQPEELRPRNPLTSRLDPPKPREESIPQWRLLASIDEDPSVRAEHIRQWKMEQMAEAGIEKARKGLGYRR